MRTVLNLALGLALFADVTGCGSEKVHSASWNIRFSEAALADRYAAIEVYILEDGCAGTTSLYNLVVERDQSPSNPPKLSKGVYGFGARVRDGSCTIFAAGCVEATLPLETDAPLDITVAAVQESSACDSSECTNGVCNDDVTPGVDAGDTDGGDGGNVLCETVTPSCEGDILHYCADEALQTLSCVLGCSTEPASCLVPSNVEGRIDVPSQRIQATVPAGATWTINTDTGGIVQTNPSVDIRPAGMGVQSDILYSPLEPVVEGGADLGVFVFETFTVEDTAQVVATGARALVLIVRTTAVVDGEISVVATGSNPGCGGYAGGAGGMSTNEIGQPGAGPGGGGAGTDNDGPTEGGGAGGSFGSQGAEGGCTTPAHRGQPMNPYGEPTLVPLAGGSGGGGGADSFGGGGGHGGGALQITAGEMLTMGVTGRINAGGGGGKGGGRRSSAGGGGSGGAILLEAPIVMILGLIGANGGAGGQGGPDTLSTIFGEDGAFGSAEIVPAPGTPDLPPPDGGAGEPGGGGGAGSDTAGVATRGRDTLNGGGGGGGAGRVRINNTEGTGNYTGITPFSSTGLSTIGATRKLP